MIKKNKTVFVALVAAVGAIVWYVTLFAPLKAERGRLDTTVSAAKAKQQELRALRVSLRELAGKQGAQQSELERMRRLVPPQPDVAGFILGSIGAADAGRSGTGTPVSSAVKWYGTIFWSSSMLRQPVA